MWSGSLSSSTSVLTMVMASCWSVNQFDSTSCWLYGQEVGFWDPVLFDLARSVKSFPMAKHTESCKHILFTMSYWRQCWSLVMQLFSFAIPLLVSDVDVVHIVLDPETMPPWQPFISGWCATALTTLYHWSWGYHGDNWWLNWKTMKTHI